MYQASRRSVSAVLQSPQLLRVLSAPHSSIYSALPDQPSRDSGSKHNGSTSGREFSGFTGKLGAGYGYSFAKSPRISVKLPGFTRLESTSAVQEEGASAAVSDGLVEKHEYQAEVTRLMDLIVHSLYSNKEVFLRELVSNASDALDKLRFLSVTDPGLLGDGGELEIRIKPDKEKGTVTILDTGIGMTKEELVDCLGTIAQSGTAKFFQALKDSKESGDSNLIGQFGVGFYSAFLVSKKVVVSTKSPKSNKQYVWEGEADNNTYVIREETDPSKLISRGTQITLHLKDDDLKLADPEKLIGLVKNYSQFVSFPIYIWKEKVQAIEVPDDSEAAKAEGKNKTKTITDKYWDWDQANETQPIWMRNSKEVTQEQYNEFYKAAFNEYLEPLACSHFNTEGEVEFRSILYVPAMSPTGKDDILNAKTKNIRLYVKRVFISDDFDGELFPKYLSFVKGVLDSNDLPLNVSREILQESRIVRVMRKRLVKKSFEMIASIAQKNAEDYKKFWENFGRFLKIGVLEDKSSHKQLAPLLRFFTSYSEDEYLSLDQYVESMKEGQKSIYYIAADSITSARNAPFLEKLLEKELEVLYLIEPIDEVAIQALKSYKDKPFVDITKEELDLGDKDEVKEKEVEKEFTPVCEWMKNHLGDKVAKVQISNRLSASPCVLVAGKFGWSANMERLMKAQPMSDPAGMEFMRGRRVLEINPNHPIIQNLSIACKDSANDTEARKAIDLLFDTALVSSGYSPDNPAELGVKIYDMMNMALSGKFGYVAPEVLPPQPSGEMASELEDTAATELKVEDGATTLPSEEGEVKVGGNSATATAAANRGEVTEAEVLDTPKTQTQ